MTTLLLPSGLSIRTLISPSSTWIERTCAGAMPSTSQIRANTCSSAGARSPRRRRALTLSIGPGWVVASIDDEDFVTLAINCCHRRLRRRRRCEARSVPTLPSPLIRTALFVRREPCDRSLNMSLPLRPSSRILSKVSWAKTTHFQRVRRGLLRCCSNWALRSKLLVHFRARANESAKRLN